MGPGFVQNAKKIKLDMPYLETAQAPEIFYFIFLRA